MTFNIDCTLILNVLDIRTLPIQVKEKIAVLLSTKRASVTRLLHLHLLRLVVNQEMNHRSAPADYGQEVAYFVYNLALICNTTSASERCECDYCVVENLQGIVTSNRCSSLRMNAFVTESASERVIKKLTLRHAVTAVVINGT